MSENNSASAVILERLGEILGVVAKAIGVAEKIQKLFPKDRNQKILSEVIDPIFLSLIEVHNSYINVFSQAISSIPKGSPGDHSIIDGSFRKISDDEAKNLLEKVRSSFREKAADFEGRRTNIRALAETYIKVFDEGSPERAFIWSVLNYFLRSDLAGQPVGDILKKADYIAQEGSHTALGTPASGTLRLIEKENNPEKIIKIVVDEKDALSIRFSDVARCYHYVVKELKNIK